MTRAAGVLFAALVLAGCDGRTWTGPLASAADSVLATRPSAGCAPDSVYYELDDIEPPLEACVASRGDTSFTVFADARRRVLVLRREIRVDPARQTRVHDSIEFHLGTLNYEAAVICAETGNPAQAEVRLWNTLDRQMVLQNVGAERVLFELRVDHPKCPAER